MKKILLSLLSSSLAILYMQLSFSSFLLYGFQEGRKIDFAGAGKGGGRAWEVVP